VIPLFIGLLFPRDVIVREISRFGCFFVMTVFVRAQTHPGPQVIGVEVEDDVASGQSVLPVHGIQKGFVWKTVLMLRVGGIVLPCGYLILEKRKGAGKENDIQ